MDWDFRTEYAKNYSVSVQRQLTSSTMVEVSFLRSAIVGADSSTVRNVPEPGAGAIGPRRPVPELANITAIRWDGYSIFNGVTFRAEQRLSRGLAFSGSYTLSKAIDDASDPGGTSFEANLPQDVRNMAAEEARASFDHRHRFVGSVTYALPKFGGGSGFASKLGSDWQVNAIVLLESGAPFTVNLGTDRANIGAGPAQRPDQTCDPNRRGGRHRGAVVQHQLLRAAAAVHLRQRTAQFRPVAWLCERRHRDSERRRAWRRHPAAAALGDLQSAEPRQLRRAEPDRVHAEFRPHLQRQAAASDAVRREDDLLNLDGAWVLGATVLS